MFVDLSGFQTGLCDRLRQVTFVATLAAAVDDFELEVYEYTTTQCPDEFTDLFGLDGFKISKIDRKPMHSIKMTPFDSSICMQTVIKHLPNSIDLHPDRVLHLWRLMYQNLKPSDRLALKVKDQLDKIAKKSAIGVHVRLGDRLSRFPGYGAITANQFDDFVRQKIPKLVAKSVRAGVPLFVASDNRLADQRIRECIAGKTEIIEFPKRWKSSGIRESSGIEFIQDLFGLAACCEIHCTTGGGVPLTANLVAGRLEEDMEIWTQEKIKYRAFLLLRRELGDLRVTFSAVAARIARK
jgi:hypothetical protein